MSWVTLLGFFVIGQALLMAAKYAFGKRSQQRVLLMLLFFVLSCYLMHEVLAYSELMLQWTFLYGWGPLFPLIIAPLLYLYVQSLLNGKFSLKPLMLLHLIPFLIALVSRSSQLLLSAEEKTMRLSRTFANRSRVPSSTSISFDWSHLWHFTLWHLQPIVYFAFIVIVIRKSKEKIYAAKDLAKWIKYLAFGLFLYFLIDYLTELLLPRQFTMEKPEIMISVFSAYVFSLCLVILKQPSSSFVINAIPEDQISKRQATDYYQRLEEIMEDKQIFLKADLQLAELAKEVGLAGRELSQIISASSGNSFNDYLNSKRVSFAKSLMSTKKYQAYTMAAIGEESGFRSKDAFYRAFKKFTNETPKAYLDRMESPDS